jgi:hypothetical protein
VTWPAAREPKSIRFAHSLIARENGAPPPFRKRDVMRFTVTLLILAAVGAFGEVPCAAQGPLTSPEDLQRQLAPGDVVVVQASGRLVSGKLTRQTAAGLEIRPVQRRDVRGNALRDLTIRVDTIEWLERPRDSVRNGVLMGAGAGAGAGAGMFLTAFAIDRNEMDEWAPFYLAATAVCTGIGALVGWAVDAARSKPYLTYRRSPAGRMTISVQPARGRVPGIGLAVAF